MSNFNSLLEQSKQLTNHVTNTGLPQLERGLDQIDSQTRRLYSTTTRESGNATIDTKTAYLLANKGFDAERVGETLNSINLTGTFEPLQPVRDTDINSYLQHRHQMIVVKAIEKGRKNILNQFQDTYERSVNKDWENTRKRIFDELGQHKTTTHHHPSYDDSHFRSSTASVFDTQSSYMDTAAAKSSFGTPQRDVSYDKNMPILPKMKHYSKVVQKINDSMINPTQKVSVIQSFHDASKKGDRTNSNEQQISDCWNLLLKVFSERNEKNQPRNLAPLFYAKLYKAQEIDGGTSEDAIKWRRMVVEGGKSFLESNFWKFIELTVEQSRSQIGGLPSNNVIVEAFINVRFKKYGNWSRNYLELYNGKAIWAHLFYLVRSGKYDDALEFVGDNESSFDRTDKHFLHYFSEWIKSPNKKLSKRTRDALLLSWNNKIRTLIAVDSKGQWQGGDPFRVAMYKMIGRCELSRKNIGGPDVTPTTDDYLWFQLMIVQEDIKPEDSAQDRYNLRDMSNQILKFGEAHFNAQGKQPIVWLQVLLICGEFERAVQFLYTNDAYMVDAVHFGIAMSYYGCLRVPESPFSGDSGVHLLHFKTVDVDGSRYDLTFLNFSKLVHSYAKLFIKSSCFDALEYFYALGLFGGELSDEDDGNMFNKSSNNVSSKEYTLLIHQYIREVVLENMDKVDKLLGSSSGFNIVHGHIQEHLKLIHIQSKQEYLELIIKQAAEKCERDGNFNDANRLYDLSGDYDKVIMILNKLLGDLLTELQYSGATAPNPSSSPSKKLKKANDIPALAQQTLTTYQNRPEAISKITQEHQRGCVLLIKLHHFMSFAQTEDYDSAIKTMDEIDIFPARHDSAAKMTHRASDLLNLDENVARSLPNIIVTLMNVYKDSFLSIKASRGMGVGDGQRQAQMQDVKDRTKNLLIFTANIRYKIPGDVYGKLVKIESNMN